MNRKKIQAILATLLTILCASSALAGVLVVYAQSPQGWSDPINLSNSGSATDPAMVIDSDEVMHVVWADTIAQRYKYVQSADGKVWTKPAYADFPFSAEADPRPSFFATADGTIYIVWRDSTNTLLVGQAETKYIGDSSSWRMVSVVAYSTVVAYDAVVDRQGVLQVGYVSVGGASTPAGVFYSQVGPAGSSKAVNLYLSEYFRSLDPASAHVRIAVSNLDNVNNIYIAWDDRPQKRVFMVKSADGGQKWGEPFEIIGPEAVTGISMPFNVEVAARSDKVLLTWQMGQPEGQCTNYSELSTNGGEQFGQPVKMSGEFALCTQASEFVRMNEDFAVALFGGLDDVFLGAWNGVRWSEPQTQEIAIFINPTTLDSVILGCQKALAYGETLYVVGCDKGTGGDIWFSTRRLGWLEDWFPPSSVWTTPAEVTNVDRQISDLSSVADSQNYVHAFWVQPASLDAVDGRATIQYARWDGEDWSNPMPIFLQSDGGPTQLDVKADNQDRLLLAWVDNKTGDMFFNWASSTRANSPAEWRKPQYIPSASQSNSSPGILVDEAGRIIVSYAIPINEKRGIYFAESEDGGASWTIPFQVFDAATAGWQIVDQPNIGLTGDGRLHVLFRQYSLEGDQRHAMGLYYAQSEDGGTTWSEPELVSEQPGSWSDVVGYDRSIVHRLWQEYKQSMLVTYDQISQDGGVTWSRPANVSSVAATSSPTTQTIDRGGNVHLLQLDSKDGAVMLHKMWNGSAWISQPSKELYIRDRGVPSSISAIVTSKGNLLAAISFDYPFLTAELKNNILSVGKSLELPEVIQTPYPAVIPAAKPTQIVVEETSAVALSPTQASPLAGVNDTPSFLSGSKNLVGYLLLAGILVVLVVIFRPQSGKENSQKKSSR